MRKVISKKIFLGIAANLDNTFYGGDATNTYAYAPSPSNTYLTINNTYMKWFKKRFPGKPIGRKYVLPAHHVLQGHPESRKMWMHFIDNILIKEIGFKTTTHDRCIYMEVIDDEVVYIVRQINDCITQTKQEQTAKNIFNIIGMKMRFASRERKGIIPFEYLGIVKDYNSVDIKQTLHYIDMSCVKVIIKGYTSLMIGMLLYPLSISMLK